MHWRDAYIAFASHPRVRPLLTAHAQAWIFSESADQILWSNPAGGRRFRIASFAGLAELRLSTASPLRRSLSTLLPNLGHREVLARLRFPGGFPGQTEACRCQRIFTENGMSGLLVVASQTSDFSGTPAELVSFLQADDTEALIFDIDGGLQAGGSVRRDRPSFDADTGRRLMRDGPSVGFEIPQGEAVLVLVDREVLAREHAVDAPPEDLGSSPKTDLPDPLTDHRARPAAAGDDSLPHVEETEADQVPVAPVQPAAGAAPPEDPGASSTIRFLWQTDSEHRILFISPGLARAVGRGCEIEGEAWSDAARRLGLDPGGRIAAALERRDTWSGLTAWWPAEGSDAWYPAEMTALPVFGIDQSFQGFRGFGVLKPANALNESEFRARFGTPGEPAPEIRSSGDRPPAGETNVVQLPGTQGAAAQYRGLARHELNAFEEIAAALNERVERRRNQEGSDEATTADPGEPSGTPAVSAKVETDAPPPAESPTESAEITSGLQVDGDLPPSTDETGPASVKQSNDMAADDADLKSRIEDLTAILNTATDGVLIIDDHGQIEDLNGSAEALFGIEKAKLIGSAFSELLSDASRQTALDYLSGLRESGVASLLNEGREVEGLASKGPIPLFMTMGRIGAADRARFCAVLRDITQWKRIESDLVSARRKAERDSSQKSDFLARVSHEIRTPLNAIIGFAELMIDERFGPVENDRYREYLRDIRTSAEHVVSLVNDLLDISKIESGKLDLSFVAVPLNELIRDCITLMQPQANRAQVVLRTSLSPEVPAIVADQRTVRQIVLNLLSNSIKFTHPGGQVIVSTSLAADGDVLLRVRDTGEGMSEAELSRALEPFRQLSTAKIGDSVGTGLGLPLTKALTEANRATFAIQSTKGEGTMVKVTFPSTRVLSE